MPKSYAECVRRLSAVSQQSMYIYDLCNGKIDDGKGKLKQCDMVYRNSFAHHEQCPRCKTPRWDVHGKARRRLRYLSLKEFLCNVLKDPELARYSAFSRECVHLASHMQGA